VLTVYVNSPVISFVYISQKLSNRLQEYIQLQKIAQQERLFPITYGGAREVMRKAGNTVDVHLTPNDLRRFAATYASRCGTPIEIVSKVILRHANLSTTSVILARLVI